MAVPAAFDEETIVLGRPPSMTVDECEPLSVFQGINEGGYPIVVSCWKFTKEELEEITKTGRVWLTILGGTMPPAYLEGISPFKEPK